VWPVYLGRKSCPPACPPFEGVGDYPTLEVALADWPWYQWNAEIKTVQARAVLESQRLTGARLRDEIVSRSRRTYAPRYTYDVSMEVEIRPIDLAGFLRTSGSGDPPGLEGGDPCTSPA
jgi:hypothetical protein